MASIDFSPIYVVSTIPQAPTLNPRSHPEIAIDLHPANVVSTSPRAPTFGQPSYPPININLNINLPSLREVVATEAAPHPANSTSPQTASPPATSVTPEAASPPATSVSPEAASPRADSVSSAAASPPAAAIPQPAGHRRVRCRRNVEQSPGPPRKRGRPNWPTGGDPEDREDRLTWDRFPASSTGRDGSVVSPGGSDQSMKDGSSPVRDSFMNDRLSPASQLSASESDVSM